MIVKSGQTARKTFYYGKAIDMKYLILTFFLSLSNFASAVILYDDDYSGDADLSYFEASHPKASNEAMGKEKIYLKNKKDLIIAYGVGVLLHNDKGPAINIDSKEYKFKNPEIVYISSHGNAGTCSNNNAGWWANRFRDLKLQSGSTVIFLSCKSGENDAHFLESILTDLSNTHHRLTVIGARGSVFHSYGNEAAPYFSGVLNKPAGSDTFSVTNIRSISEGIIKTRDRYDFIGWSASAYKNIHYRMYMEGEYTFLKRNGYFFDGQEGWVKRTMDYCRNNVPFCDGKISAEYADEYGNNKTN